MVAIFRIGQKLRCEVSTTPAFQDVQTARTTSAAVSPIPPSDTRGSRWETHPLNSIGRGKACYLSERLVGIPGTFAFTRALLFRAPKFVKSKGGNDETRFDRPR